MRRQYFSILARLVPAVAFAAAYAQQGPRFR